MKGTPVIKGGIVMFLLGIVIAVTLGNYLAYLIPVSMVYWLIFSSSVIELGGIIMVVIGVILWAAEKRKKRIEEEMKITPQKSEKPSVIHEKAEKKEKIGVYRCVKCGHDYMEAKTICVLCGNEVKEVKG